MTGVKLVIGLLFVLNTAALTLIFAVWSSHSSISDHNRLILSALVLIAVNIVINALLYISLY